MSASVPNIRPISDLRTHLNDVCAMAQETQEPISMTKNGKATLMVIDCDAYRAQQEHDRYVQKLREAEIEARYQEECVSPQQLEQRLKTAFDKWGV